MAPRQLGDRGLAARRAGRERQQACAVEHDQRQIIRELPGIALLAVRIDLPEVLVVVAQLGALRQLLAEPPRTITCSVGFPPDQ